MMVDIVEVEGVSLRLLCVVKCVCTPASVWHPHSIRAHERFSLLIRWFLDWIQARRGANGPGRGSGRGEIIVFINVRPSPFSERQRCSHGNHLGCESCLATLGRGGQRGKRVKSLP